MTANGIIQKLWNYCNILRDDGLSYGDYVEQLTFGYARACRQQGERAVNPVGDVS